MEHQLRDSGAKIIITMDILFARIAEVADKVSFIAGNLIELYGMTEMSPVMICNPLQGKKKPGSIGMPLPDTCPAS